MVLRRCNVNGCPSHISEVSLHRFPSTLKRAIIWKQFCQNPKLEAFPLEKLFLNAAICRKHFAPEQYSTAECLRLNRNALPSLLPPSSFLFSSSIKSTSATSTPTPGFSTPLHSSTDIYPEKDVTSSDETPSVELNDSDSITDAREKVQISTVSSYSFLSTLGSQNDTTCLSSNSTGDCSAEDSDNEAHPEGEEPVLENNPTTIQRYIYRHVENPSHVIEESPELYALVTLPFLEQTNLDLQWVYKILSGEEGSSRVIYQSPNKDDKDGFLMIKGFRWDGVNLYNLHVLAIVYRPGILSLRDLRGDHLSLLQNIFCIGKEQIIRKYGVEESQLRIFVQYQPSFFHFNVHFTAMNDGICELTFDKAHSLCTVINNIKICPTYYQISTLTMCLKETDELFLKYEALGIVKRFQDFRLRQ